VASQLDELAKAAYIYGYPLVYDLDEVTSQTTTPKMSYSSPINLFGYANRLANPDDEFVSLNNDTLYTFAHCDVTNEPLVLHLPDTHDRYYVMQFVDAWTNNFAYLGRRASGTKEGVYLLAGPDWQGETPDGMTLVQTPTNVFSIIGRYAVDGEADIPNVAILQQATWVTPLSRYPERPVTEGRAFGDWDVAPWNANVPDDLAFWEKLRAWSQLFPPAAADAAFIASLAPLGLTAKESPFISADPALVDILKTGAAEGQAIIEGLTKRGSVEPVNGWISAMHTFDYNLDHFGPGTVDSPEWKISDRQMAYAVRAAAARAGLWGNHGYEAVYAYTYVDDKNEQLTGERAYVMHFDQTPPVEAFWSLTMYNMPQYYLVANTINRYSIGDRTPRIQYNADGSLDLYIQHASPGPDKESNWLPAPVGDFRPLMRMYQPKPAVLNGEFKIPAIRRVE
jgi:hypothetical protein